MKDNVKGNLFNGTDEVELSTTLGEAEVLFAANDNVNELAESGNLKQLHDNCNNLSEAAESSYINCKDRLMGLIGAGHNKEDEVVGAIVEPEEPSPVPQVTVLILVMMMIQSMMIQLRTAKMKTQSMKMMIKRTYVVCLP